MKQYPTDPTGELDVLGIEAPRRPKPCLKRTWCLLTADHEGSCVEVPRRKER